MSKAEDKSSIERSHIDNGRGSSPRCPDICLVSDDDSANDKRR